MTRTGWIGDEPEETPVSGFAGFILAHRGDPGEGRTMEQVLGRAALPSRYDREPEPFDDDDRIAAMVTRGYRPGASLELSQQLGECVTELQAEQEKIERGQRRAEQVRRMHEHGQIRAWDIPNLLGDEGDESRVRLLERRAASLRTQIQQSQEAIAPPQARALDPVEAASRRAHQVFREVTRQRMAEAEAGTSPSRARRPFVSRAFGDGQFDVPQCEECVKAGATAEESVLLHLDPALTDSTPDFMPQPEVADRWPHRFDTSGHENPGQEIRRGNLGVPAGAA